MTLEEFDAIVAKTPGYQEYCASDSRNRKVLRVWLSYLKEQQEEVILAVRERLQRHLMQGIEWQTVDGGVYDQREFFGSEVAPRCPDEAWRMEAKFPLSQSVDRDGQAVVQCVTLRVWADWDCKAAIEINKAMVANACNAAKLSFKTAMQTDVQARVVVMWLRLRGNFFWNERMKTHGLNLYFDGELKLLRNIHSDEFCAWLHAATQINPKKADWEFLMSRLDAVAMCDEVSSPCVPAALFDRRGDVVYVSCGKSDMVRVSAAVGGVPRCEVVSNGTDGVVFDSGNVLRPWALLDGDGIDPFAALAPFSTANYASEHGRMIARLWTLALPACLRTYPAIIFTGKMRSGKSRTAKALFELLGIEVRLAAIRERGEADFWTTVNRGGVVCFDNVDTRNTWFGDAMQLVCTDGSTEKRTLYSDTGTTRLEANSKVIMTSNNPLFASESGLSDRLQIVRLNQFVFAGKEVSDAGITAEINAHRDEALTWLVKTISRALADDAPVEANVNMRHPDFAAFALRCARALSAGEYEAAIGALRSAEFDKAILSLQNHPTLVFVLEVFTDKFIQNPWQKWEGTAGDIMKEIIVARPDLQNQRWLSATSVGKAVAKNFESLAMLFNMEKPRRYGSQTRYVFAGLNDIYAKNLNIEVEDEEDSSSDENDEGEYEDVGVF